VTYLKCNASEDLAVLPVFFFLPLIAITLTNLFYLYPDINGDICDLNRQRNKFVTE
jgi:hypothetical protein